MRRKLTYGLALTILVLSTSACSSKDNDPTSYEKGISYMESGSYKEAADSFEDALDKDSRRKSVKKQNKKALRGKGIALYFDGKYEEAIDCLKEAVSLNVLNELNQDINEYLGKCYFLTNQYEAAVETYDILLKEDKNNYSYYIEKSRVLFASKDEKGAETTLNDALKLKAKSEEEKYQQALCQYELGDKEATINTLNEIKDSYAPAWAFLGDVYFNDKEYEKAAVSYDAYLGKEENTDTSEISYKLSNCYIREKNYKKAIVVIEEALGGQTIKEKQSLMYNQVLAYEYNTDFDQAYILAKEYVKAYPKDKAMARELVFLETRYKG